MNFKLIPLLNHFDENTICMKNQDLGVYLVEYGEGKYM